MKTEMARSRHTRFIIAKDEAVRYEAERLRKQRIYEAEQEVVVFARILYSAYKHHPVTSQEYLDALTAFNLKVGILETLYLLLAEDHKKNEKPLLPRTDDRS